MDTTDIFNKYGVASNSKGIVFLMPPREPMTDDEAVQLAAWLVAMALRPTLSFKDVLDAIQR